MAKQIPDPVLVRLLEYTEGECLVDLSDVLTQFEDHLRERGFDFGAANVAAVRKRCCQEVSDSLRRMVRASPLKA